MAQINKPNEYFNPVTYTGNGSTQAVTGVGFQPDWTWIKCRNDAQEPRLVDSLRGATKYLDSSLALAEFTDTTILTSFDTDGFTLGANAISNLNGNTHVAWNWKAGGTAVSNTDGSITSSVSANTTSGFSVVKYTGNGSDGATVGHGLGAVPKLIMYKELTEARNWYVFTNVIDGTYDQLALNLTDTKVDRAITLPTSSLFSLSTSNEHNASGQDYISYCFAEKKGFSKFGSYAGNTSVDGTFLYLGFKPAFLLVKGTTTLESWIMFDNQRGNQGVRANPQDLRLLANANNTEADIDIDFLSNGVKFRTAENAVDHANTYMYMAFAENPLVGTNNIPATAR